eukprot:6189161-Pleurochrysis_carterae.AAC.4
MARAQSKIRLKERAHTSAQVLRHACLSVEVDDARQRSSESMLRASAKHPRMQLIGGKYKPHCYLQIFFIQDAPRLVFRVEVVARGSGVGHRCVGGA